MSRTTRRPNYLDHKGASTWSKEDVHCLEYDCIIKTGNGHGGCKQLRPMTKQERADHLRFMYGESRHRNSRSPGRGYRHPREVELRMHTKTELFKWFKNPEHEVIVPDNPQDCWWDWS